MKELLQIQQRLKAPKDKKNDFGGYKYRSAESILEAVKPILGELGCTLTLSDNPIQVGNYVYIYATATLTNESNESVIVTACAREAASKKGMDDSQLTGSTSSYARKYALNGLFAIDDTKDADTNEFKIQQQNAVDKYKNDLINSINGCTTIQQLQAVWSQIPVDWQRVAEVSAAKDEKKAELTK